MRSAARHRRPVVRGTHLGEVELAEGDRRARRPRRGSTPGQLRYRGHHVGSAAGRGFTGRAKIIKFAGCYHGHVDALLAEAGSGVATLGLPTSRPA